MIRFAKKEDGIQIAKLLMVIFKDMELPFIKEHGEDKTIEVLLDAMDDPTYRYGYDRGIVKVIDGEIAGAAFGYSAEDESAIDQPLNKSLLEHGIDDSEELFTDPEVLPNEWYLDSISVNENYRGQGIGTELLEALPLLAERENKNIIGLNVDKTNPKAKKLYAREGFEAVGEMTISGHVYDHMQLKF